jgi:hypothetical protein
VGGVSGADVDHPAVAAADHVGEGGAGGVVGGGQVEEEVALEQLVVVLERGQLRDIADQAADVVDEHVEAAEPLTGLLDRRLQRLSVHAVDDDREALAADLARLGGNRIELVGAAREHGDAGTLGGEAERDRPADAATATRENRDPLAQSPAHRSNQARRRSRGWAR